MLLTTQFLTLVMLTVWKVPTPIAVCFHLFFSAIEGTYFSACAEKVPTGKLEPLECNSLHQQVLIRAANALNLHGNQATTVVVSAKEHVLAC